MSIPATDWDKKRKALNADRHPHDYLRDEKHMFEKLRDEYGAYWKIASVLGVSEQTVMKRMMRLGVAPSRPYRDRLGEDRRKQARALLASGRTCSEIVAATGISLRAVRRIFKERASGVADVA